MPRVALTDRFVSGAKARGTPQTDYFDADTAGLALRVTSKGVKTWSLIFTSPKDGKRARMTLGRYPQTKLAAARGLAIEARGYLDVAKDPRDVLAGPDGAMTVEALVESYLEKYARRELRRPEGVERTFRKNVLPLVGAVRLGDLHRGDVNRVIDPILKRGSPTEAARCFAYMRALFRWAVGRGDLDRNPMEGMQKPGEGVPRDRVLTDREIATPWTALPKALARSKPCQRIITLCLVTAQRVGEIAGMRPGELDLQARLWTIPGDRTKNGHKHTVPLSRSAVKIIEEALKDAGQGGATCSRMRTARVRWKSTPLPRPSD
jgi:integrase